MLIDRHNFFRWSQLSVMFGGYLLLMCEIRFEHRAVLLEDWRPWIPVVYCGAMLLVIPAAGVIWERGGKKLLLAAYSLTIMIGGIGLVFHSEGKLLQRLIEVFSVWTSSLESGASLTSSHPPLLAPCAFLGLGMIGLLFSIEGSYKFPSKSASHGTSTIKELKHESISQP